MLLFYCRLTSWQLGLSELRNKGKKYFFKFIAWVFLVGVKEKKIKEIIKVGFK